MESSVDPDEVASLEASWSGYTLFSKEGIEFWKGYRYSALIRSNMVYILKIGTMSHHFTYFKEFDWLEKS